MLTQGTRIRGEGKSIGIVLAAVIKKALIKWNSTDVNGSQRMGKAKLMIVAPFWGGGTCQAHQGQDGHRIKLGGVGVCLKKKQKKLKRARPLSGMEGIGRVLGPAAARRKNLPPDKDGQKKAQSYRQCLGGRREKGSLTHMIRPRAIGVLGAEGQKAERILAFFRTLGRKGKASLTSPSRILARDQK